jgi:hypothetical protein
MNGATNGTTNGVTTGRPRSRRGFLQAAFGGVALLAAGRVAAARAEPTKSPDQSAAELKSSCEQYGGVYIESKKDDIIACFWPNKGKTVCKYNGTGCYNYDSPKMVNHGGSIAVPVGYLDGAAHFEAAMVAAQDPAAGKSGVAAVTGGSKGRRCRGKGRKR